MDGIALLAEARAAGLLVTVAGDRLTVRGPRRAAAVARRLIAGKAAVIVALASDATDPETHADREIRRFVRVAVPYPDGRGWYDPGALRDKPGRALLAFYEAERTAEKPRARLPYAGSLPGHVAGLGGAACDPWAKLARRGPDGLTAVERAEAYLAECQGLPPGAKRLG